MNTNEFQNGLIEKFLDQKLSSIQKEAFDKELINEDFRNELILRAQMVDAHKSNEKEQMVKELNNIAKNYKKEPRKNRNLGILIGIIALCLSFYAINFFLGPNLKSQELYANYFIELPADVSQRGEQNDQAENYKNAMQAYSNRDYNMAFKLFEEIKPATASINLYKATCLMQLGKYQEAKKLMLPIAAGPNENLRENAEWYLSLIEIQADDFDAAKSILHTILQNEEHLFIKKAESLMTAIK